MRVTLDRSYFIIIQSAVSNQQEWEYGNYSQLDQDRPKAIGTSEVLHRGPTVTVLLEMQRPEISRHCSRDLRSEN